jgi:hypothetical protein
MIKSNISIFIKHEYHTKRQFYVESTLVKHRIALQIASKKNGFFFSSFFLPCTCDDEQQGLSYRVVDYKRFAERKVYKKKQSYSYTSS